MSRSVNPGNTFALLREEASILKQKEKRERALQRKAVRDAEAAKAAAQPKPVSPKPIIYTLNHGLSWADMSDDDEDEDDFDEPHKEPELDVEDYFSSSESESEDDEGATEAAVAGPDSATLPCRLPPKRTSTSPPVAAVQERTLSKKERKQKELEELDELLGDLGLKDESKAVAGQSTGEVPATEVSTASGTTGKKRKKPANKRALDENDASTSNAPVTESQTTGEPRDTEELVVMLSREEAKAALKKGVAKKKKPTSSTSVLPASVLAEAKKKAEAKKAKQKKEKHFDR